MRKPALTTKTLKVDGVKVLRRPPRGVKPQYGPFYRDGFDSLRTVLRMHRDRSTFVVAPQNGGFSIYRRRARK